MKNAGRSMMRMLPRRVGAWLRARTQPAVATHSEPSHQPTDAAQAFASIGAREGRDINDLLHHLRGQALDRLPKGVDHFVSVGCSGLWYFDWIARRCEPKLHTGIEFYSPRPEGLPAGTAWISNTAGNMEAVPDATADVLFSGQNIEHLWPEDVGNFLLESHRVVKPGGLLVVDSPNRRITSRLNWSHGEHTIEFEPAEARELLLLAGFDVLSCEGIWLCETDRGAVLPFDQITTGGEWPALKRTAEAAGAPARSFIWWIEARRADREPDVARLRQRIREIHELAWPERLNRLLTSIGSVVQRNGETWFDSGGRAGALTFGPYTALPPGSHELVMTLEYCEPIATGAPCGTVHVSGGPQHEVLVRAEVPARQAGQQIDVRLPFHLADTTFGIQFVVAPPAGTRMLARKAVRLHSSPDL